MHITFFLKKILLLATIAILIPLPGCIGGAPTNTLSESERAALVCMNALFKGRTSSTNQKVYVNLEGLPITKLLGLIDSLHPELLKTGVGYEQRNGKLVEKETGQPCASVNFALRAMSSDEATFRVQWTPTTLSSSVREYKLERKNNTWSVVSSDIIMSVN